MIYAQWLHSVPGIGAAALDRMLQADLTARDIYRMDERRLHGCGLFSETQIAAVLAQHAKDPQAEWEKLVSAGIRFVCRENRTIPGKLLRITRPPYGLYVIGKLPDERRFSVAVVGARECTSYGAAVSRKIGKELAENGVVVISGMARGVDGCAHRGALDADGCTVAVLGCGIDRCYPSVNRDLYRRIPEKGCLISEFAPGTAALSENFPQRNRIISAFSDCVIVAEARRRSGSLITAELAAEQGKDVYAVPGPVDSVLSYGCHHLIHQGAGIWYSMSEFLHDQSMDFGGHVPDEAVRSLELSQRKVYSAVVLLPKSIEEIGRETGIKSRDLIQILLDLQLKGLIAEIGKGRYVRLQAADPEEKEVENSGDESGYCGVTGQDKDH